MPRNIQNVLTNVGLSLIQRSLAETSPVVFTRCALGTGLIDDSADIKQQTELVFYLDDAVIQGKKVNPSGDLQITASFWNDKLVVTTEIREIGIYGKLAVDDDSSAVLFSYLTFGDYPAIVPPPEVQGTQRIFDIPFHFGSGQTVGVTLTPSGLIDSSEVSVDAAAGEIPRVGEDGLLHADISGSAARFGGKLPSDYATADHTHDNATAISDGFMSATDKTRLDTINDRVNQGVKTNDSPTFAGLTVNGIISGARFV